MASTTYFSDHFATQTAATASPSTVTSPIVRVSAGVSGSRVRYKRAQVITTIASDSTDVYRFFTLKSGARLINMWISSDGGCTAGSVDVGLHLSGTNHDGAVVDANLFGDDVTVSSAISKTAVVIEATTIQHEDTGLTLWEMANIGAATLTEDPLVNYDITATPNTTLSVAVCELTLECLYTDGT